MPEQSETDRAIDAYTILKFAVKHEIYDMLFLSDTGETFIKSAGDVPAGIYFSINCNDLFFWACADDEPVTVADLPDLEQAICDCKAIEPVCGHIDGCHLFAARKQKMRPQNCCYPTETLWPLFDACGPERPDDTTQRKVKANA